MLSCATLRGAEASTPVVPVGRCTTPPSLPGGRGWGARIRRGVATGVAPTPTIGLTRAMVTMVTWAMQVLASAADAARCSKRCTWTSTTMLLTMRAGAQHLFGPAGRCTTFSSRPFLGRGWLRWIRRGVPSGEAPPLGPAVSIARAAPPMRRCTTVPVAVWTACGRQPLAAAEACATILAAEPMPVIRPARGRATSICITVRHLRHIGTSANITGDFVDTLESLYVGNALNIMDVSFRGVAPGAAPTRRQRGPRS